MLTVLLEARQPASWPASQAASQRAASSSQLASQPTQPASQAGRQQPASQRASQPASRPASQPASPQASTSAGQQPASQPASQPATPGCQCRSVSMLGGFWEALGPSACRAPPPLHPPKSMLAYKELSMVDAGSQQGTHDNIEIGGCGGRRRQLGNVVGRPKQRCQPWVPPALNEFDVLGRRRVWFDNIEAWGCGGVAKASTRKGAATLQTWKVGGQGF